MLAMSDADGLKAFNDRFGYAAGDELLRAKADALREAGLEAYHDKGDEFLYRGENQEDLRSKLDNARNILRERIFDGTEPNGETVQLQGVDFSYGTGPDLKAAESALKGHKSEREARGERARGELGPGVKVTRQNEVEGQTKFKFGNTQADIPADSEAAKALGRVQKAIDPADLAGTVNGAEGGLETTPHVTVRYGIKGEDTAGIVAFLEKQSPFEASLGATQAFPASEHSDGAVPIIAPVESPDLHRLEAELDKHGDFKERSFPEYKPHATVAYVKPDAAQKYVGLRETAGKTFTIDTISISKRDGSSEPIKLKGKANVESGNRGEPRAADGIKEQRTVTLTHGESDTDAHEFQTRSSTDRGSEASEGGNAEEALRQRKFDSALDWLEAASRDDREAERDAASKMSREYQTGEAGQTNLPERANRERLPIRAPSGDGENTGATTSPVGARPPQGPRRGEQRTGESGIAEPRRSQPDALQRERPDKVHLLSPETSRQVVAQIRQMRDVRDNGTKMRLARQVRKLLHEGTPTDAQKDAIVGAVRSAHESLDRSSARASTTPESAGGKADESLRKRPSETVLQRQPEQNRAEGGGRVQPGKQGNEPARKGTKEESALAESSSGPQESVGDLSEALSQFLFKVAKRQAMESKGQDILDQMEESGESPRALSDHFWDDIYPKLPAEIQRRFERYAKAISGFEPGSVVAVGPKGQDIIAEDWPAVGRALNLADKPEYLEGTDRGLVVYMKEAERRFRSQLSTSASENEQAKLSAETKPAKVETPLDKFENEGKSPYEITKKEWVELQKAHRRSLGQPEDSGTRYAPTADYEEYHRDSVKTALKMGLDVPGKVLKDYPDLEATREGRTVDHNGWKITANIATGSWTVKSPDGKTVTTAAPTLEAGKEIADKYLSKPVQATPEGVTKQEGAEGKPIPKGAVELTPQTEVPKSGRNFEGRYLQAALEPAKEKWDKTLEKIPEVGFSEPKTSNGTESLRAQLLTGEYPQPTLVLSRRGTGNWSITFEDYHTEPGSKSPIKVSQEIGQTGTLKLAKEVAEGRLRSGTYYDPTIPVKAGFRIVKGYEGPEGLKELKPKGLTADKLVVQVPGDGRFTIPNNPAAIDGAIAKADKFVPPTPGRVPAARVPKAPTEFDEQKHIANLKRQIEEHETDLRRAQRDPSLSGQVAFHQEQLDAARAELAEITQTGRTSDEIAGSGPVSRSGEEGSEKTEPPAAAEKRSDLGSTTYAGGLDPELFKQLFPSAPEAFAEWTSDAPTTGETQRAVMREQRGTKDRNFAMAKHKLRKVMREWDSRPREDSIKMWNAIEHVNGATIDDLDPKDRALSQLIERFYQQRKDAIEELRPDEIQHWNENYAAHWWEHPSQARKAIMAVISGKRPFAGRASFRKARTVMTIQDGIDMGLTPQTWNPVRGALMKMHEMDQFIMGYKTLDIMKGIGTAKLVRVGQKRPDGWTQLDDRIGTVYGRETTIDKDRVDDATYDKTYMGGKRPIPSVAREDLDDAMGEALTIRGHYYAPDDAAKAFNRYVSKGLAGRSGIFDALNWINSNLNLFQLAISGFHATMTTNAAAASDAGLAIQQATEGKVFKAGASLIRGATLLPSLFNTWRNGVHLMSEYLDPGTYAKVRKEAEWLGRAGGRIEPNSVEIKPLDKAINAFRNGAVVEGLSAVPGTILQGITDPLMRVYVPTMKLGAFYTMAANTLETAEKQDWTQDAIRARMQEHWKSVDNRFGELVYDNLFWHRAVRDCLQLTTRSVGYTYGTIDEFGGAATDTARQAARAISGQKPRVTDRMAFAIGAFLTAGIMGGVLTYLMTGERPREWKDYYFPRKADGSRLSMPVYPPQIINFMHDPIQTLVNKVSPILGAFTEAIQNRNFYHVEIRHPDDSGLEQLGEFSKWAAKQPVPFAAESAERQLKARGAGPTLRDLLREAKEHPGDVVLGAMGFNPAPAWIQHSPALNKAYEYEQINRPSGTRTQAQADKSDAMHAIEAMYRQKRVDQDAINSYKKAGVISEQDLLRAKLYSRTDPLTRAVRSLTGHPEQVLNVYKEADPGEQKLLRPLVEAESRKLQNMPMQPEQKDALRKAFRDALNPSLAQLRSKAS